MGEGGLGMTMGDVVTKVYRSQRCGLLYEIVVEYLSAVNGDYQEPQYVQASHIDFPR